MSVQTYTVYKLVFPQYSALFSFFFGTRDPKYLTFLIQVLSLESEPFTETDSDEVRTLCIVLKNKLL